MSPQRRPVRRAAAGGHPSDLTTIRGRPSRPVLAWAFALFIVAFSGLWVRPAEAHDPIFVTEGTSPEDSPLIADGTISFATYGRIDEPGGSAAFRLRLQAGEPLTVEVLVPDRPPENLRDDHAHLRVEITNPDGSADELRAGPVIETFDEPFTQTQYLRLLVFEEVSTGGVHQVVITSDEPTRFTVATGQIEQFGTAVEDYERQPLTVLTEWYETSVSTTVPATTSVVPPSAEPSISGEAASEPTGGDDGTSLVAWPGVIVVLAAVGATTAVVVRRARKPSL